MVLHIGGFFTLVYPWFYGVFGEMFGVMIWVFLCVMWFYTLVVSGCELLPIFMV